MSFRVSPAQLQAAKGVVRCGACLGIFSAVANTIQLKSEHGPESSDDDSLFDALEAEAVADSLLTETDGALARDLDDATLAPASAAAHVVDEEEAELAAAFPDTYANPGSSLRDDLDVSLGDFRLDDEEAEDEAADQPAEAEAVAPPALGAEAALLTEDRADSDPPAATREPAPMAERADAQVLPRKDAEEQDAKAVLREQLAELAETEALGPVADAQIARLDAVPITLQGGRSLQRRLGRLGLLLVNLLLLLCLPAQWLYVNRSLLSADPYFAPLAPLVCRLFACAPPRDAPQPTAIYSQQLLVRSHPDYENALEVSFVFHNDSPAAQRFPDVELLFSDTNGQPVANRLFGPREYLPVELRQLDDMPAKSSVQAQLELVDPGQQAVHYTLKIHDRPVAE
jgi:predicted Zn finger-like uncharacterized protein